MKYNVTVYEVYRVDIMVEADSEDSAKEKAKDELCMPDQSLEEHYCHTTDSSEWVVSPIE